MTFHLFFPSRRHRRRQHSLVRFPSRTATDRPTDQTRPAKTAWASSTPSEDAGPAAAPPSLSAPELEGDRAGSAVDNIASTSAAAAAAARAGAGIELPTGERLYNPYEGLAAAVDGRGMRGQYRLPAQVRGRLETGISSKSGQMMKRFLMRREKRFAVGALPRIASLRACIAQRRLS